MSSDPSLKIAAILYEPRQGPGIDLMLAAIVAELRSRGVRLAGTLQWNAPSQAGPCLDMVLEDIHTGQRINVTENRGAVARGCRLDSRALEDVAGLTRASLDDDIDLVIVNKFAKCEADGGGLRQVIETAVAGGIPVLVGLNTAHRAAWEAFAGGATHWLTADADAVRAWCRSVLAPHETEAGGTGARTRHHGAGS